jgi:hypothetical protein
MSQEALWLRVQQECPRRIIGELHCRGEYLHGTTPRFPGKVLCCHKDTPLPEGWTPTPAQQQATQGARGEASDGKKQGGQDEHAA